MTASIGGHPTLSGGHIRCDFACELSKPLAADREGEPSAAWVRNGLDPEGEYFPTLPPIRIAVSNAAALSAARII